MRFIDLNKEIESREKAIARQIKESGLTKEQLRQADHFNYFYDKYFIRGKGSVDEDIKAKNIFWDIAKTEMENFDYKTAMQIERQKDVLDVLKEVQRDKGFLMYGNGGLCGAYYTFSSCQFKNGKEIIIYTWDADLDWVQDIEIDNCLEDNEELKEDEVFRKMLATI